MLVLGWVVARTKAQRELYAADNLARQEYEYYLPRILVRQQALQRIVPQPLFPSYIFIHVKDRWRSILSTYGITSLVTNGGSSLATVAQREIDKLRRREDDDGFVRLEQPPRQFHIGDAVRIKDGLHAGGIGIYAGHSPRERCRILMDYLGCKSKVLIAEEQLELA